MGVTFLCKSRCTCKRSKHVCDVCEQRAEEKDRFKTRVFHSVSYGTCGVQGARETCSHFYLSNRARSLYNWIFHFDHRNSIFQVPWRINSAVIEILTLLTSVFTYYTIINCISIKSKTIYIIVVLLNGKIGW